MLSPVTAINFLNETKTAITPVYAEPNRERSEAHKVAEGHARNEAEVWLRHDTLVRPDFAHNNPSH